MTSPTDKPRQSRTSRLSRTSSSSTRRASDPEARFTRNVTIAFVAIIGTAIVAVILALAYGFWESNLKPLANVQGTEIGRGEWDDRQRLEQFRADRAVTATRAALLAGDIDEALANRRLTDADNAVAAGAPGAMENLVDLIYQEQLAQDLGITLADDELAAALAADGTFPEMRRIAALVIQPTGTTTGTSTADDRAAARQQAEAALAALREGTPIADLVDEYSPATASTGGDLGYGTLEDARGIDPAWADAVFALEEGESTDIFETAQGDLLIGVATAIAPEQRDPGFLTAVKEQVGEDIHLRNVEREALAAKLKERITEDAVAAEYEQVKLAGILIAGDTLADPEQDEGSIRASHILYQPEASPEPETSPEPEVTPAPETSPGGDGSPVPASSPEPEATLGATAEPEATAEAETSPGPDATAEPDDESAWAAAQALAEQAAAELRAVADVEARMQAFASRAAVDGTDATAQRGGDLGFFERGDMVPEFADPLFDAEGLQQGDIIGPVRSEFGWHVIMFNEARAPTAERLAAVQAALAAEGADFAAVAAEFSDGPEAQAGGEIGWQVLENLDDIVRLALSAIGIGEISEPIDGDEGYTIYQKQDEATRPLEPTDAARKAQFAFTDWYEEQRLDAEDAGEISIDDTVYER
jgi:parvulin-like peptidyl-prolyl isomerase